MHPTALLPDLSINLKLSRTQLKPVKRLMHTKHVFSYYEISSRVSEMLVLNIRLISVQFH